MNKEHIDRLNTELLESSLRYLQDRAANPADLRATNLVGTVNAALKGNASQRAEAVTCLKLYLSNPFFPREAVRPRAGFGNPPFVERTMHVSQALLNTLKAAEEFLEGCIQFRGDDRAEHVLAIVRLALAGDAAQQKSAVASVKEYLHGEGIPRTGAAAGMHRRVLECEHAVRKAETEAAPNGKFIISYRSGAPLICALGASAEAVATSLRAAARQAISDIEESFAFEGHRLSSSDFVEYVANGAAFDFTVRDASYAFKPFTVFELEAWFQANVRPNRNPGQFLKIIA